MKYMNFKEFYDRLVEYADLMNLGLSNVEVHKFVFVNLKPIANSKRVFWHFISIRYTQMNFHEIGYLDEFMNWYYQEFNDDVIPEWILDKIKENYPKALKTIKFEQLQNKYEKIQEDFK